MAHETLTISAANRPEELGRIASELGGFAEENDLPMRSAMHLDLAVEEIVSNVIKYGFEADDVRDDAIEIALTLRGDSLAIRIADRGRAFNPLEDAPVPDIEAEVEDRPIGGLGVHIVKATMAELRYTRDGGRNILDMVLSLNAPA
jgi:anti-sigma regulatory factor (Ser/Thr protein kinase)